MHVVALDPGSQITGWVVFDTLTRTPAGFGIDDNDDVVAQLRKHENGGVLVTEYMEPRGMPTSAEEMRTLWWTGRFREAFGPRYGEITRRQVKLHVCGSMRARDPHIRQALIDRYGGKESAIGRKATPGPLYGMKSHCWSALAVAIAWCETWEGRP